MQQSTYDLLTAINALGIKVHRTRNNKWMAQSNGSLGDLTGNGLTPAQATKNLLSVLGFDLSNGQKDVHAEVCSCEKLRATQGQVKNLQESSTNLGKRLTHLRKSICDLLGLPMRGTSNGAIIQELETLFFKNGTRLPEDISKYLKQHGMSLGDLIKAHSSQLTSLMYLQQVTGADSLDDIKHKVRSLKVCNTRFRDQVNDLNRLIGDRPAPRGCFCGTLKAAQDEAKKLAEYKVSSQAWEGKLFDLFGCKSREGALDKARDVQTQLIVSQGKVAELQKYYDDIEKWKSELYGLFRTRGVSSGDELIQTIKELKDDFHAKSMQVCELERDKETLRAKIVDLETQLVLDKKLVRHSKGCRCIPLALSEGEVERQKAILADLKKADPSTFDFIDLRESNSKLESRLELLRSRLCVIFHYRSNISDQILLEAAATVADQAKRFKGLLEVADSNIRKIAKALNYEYFDTVDDVVRKLTQVLHKNSQHQKFIETKKQEEQNLAIVLSCGNSTVEVMESIAELQRDLACLQETNETLVQENGSLKLDLSKSKQKNPELRTVKRERAIARRQATNLAKHRDELRETIGVMMDNNGTRLKAISGMLNCDETWDGVISTLAENLPPVKPE